MAALTAPRNTRRWGESFRLVEPPVKAATTIFQGSLVVRDAGFCAPGRTATGLIALGRAEETVVNSGAAGAKNCKVLQGVFPFANSAAGDLIAQADVGAQCFIVDDQTVAKTNGGATRSVAGIVEAVDAEGVWVRIGEDNK